MKRAIGAAAVGMAVGLGLGLTAAGGAAPGRIRLDPLDVTGTAGGFPIGGGFFGEPTAAANVSGVATFIVGGRRVAAIGVDEGHEFALVQLDGPEKGRAQRFDLGRLVEQSELGAAEEIDLEGASYGDGRLYLCGSAALKRKKPNKKKAKKNRQRLRTVEPVSGGEPGAWKRHSDMLFVLEVAAGDRGLGVRLEAVHDLRTLLLSDSTLGVFAPIPSKDNGLDVEAYLRHGGRHYFGLRGPVLRGHAVVAVVDDAFEKLELRFLALDGLGIRAMEALQDTPWGPGIFLVAGRTMEGPGPFTLYRWDGESDAFMKPGAGLGRVGDIAVPDPGYKVESLFDCPGGACVSFDGPAGGQPSRLRK